MFFKHQISDEFVVRATEDFFLTPAVRMGIVRFCLSQLKLVLDFDF